MIRKLKMENLNLLFAAALILLIYKTPAFLSDISNSIFGRASLVIILSYILLYCDLSCAILFALIIIILFHNKMEGFNQDEEGFEQEEEDGEEDEEEDGEEDGGEDGEEVEDVISGEAVEEGFLGVNFALQTGNKALKTMRRVITHNLTDLDRLFKTNSEINSMAATKQ